MMDPKPTTMGLTAIAADANIRQAKPKPNQHFIEEDGYRRSIWTQERQRVLRLLEPVARIGDRLKVQGERAWNKEKQ